MELSELSGVCRLCFKSHQDNLDIFSNPDLEEKMMTVFNYTINYHDQLSQIVCSTCFGFIYRIHNFLEMVGKNQAYLDALLLAADDGTSSQEIPDHSMDLEVEEQFITEKNASTPESTLQITAELDLIDSDTQPDDDDDCIVVEEESLLQKPPHRKRSPKKGERHPCDQCDTTFSRKGDLQRHRKNKHDPLYQFRFVCNICDRPLSTKYNLNVHMMQHAEVSTPKVQCDICQEWCKNGPALRSHKAYRHKNQRTLNCEFCGISNFANKIELRHHLLELHQGSKKPDDVTVRRIVK
ncbi:zinc finger protein weckle-like [Uranotaenia lowii]|uniref:zinc finger protein weckle-like n=1 Tax=Uranotaenia lowii TaxID=190385 RepID=UPI002478EF92|nr:zinc finger protein weckle-like [Uranotaenia lowii]